MILQKSDPHCITVLIRALKRGEVAIIPTDTVYGFSGIVPQSASALRNIKGRGENKPFIQLIAEPEDIGLYSDSVIPQHIRALMPGALTLIVRTQNGTTAFRCPDDEWLRSVIRLCGAPLYSTSVNRSGCPVLTDIALMEKEFGAKVFCVVDGGKAADTRASTIVDVSGPVMRIVRQGSVRVDLPAC